MTMKLTFQIQGVHYDQMIPVSIFLGPLRSKLSGIFLVFSRAPLKLVPTPADKACAAGALAQLALTGTNGKQRICFVIIPLVATKNLSSSNTNVLCCLPFGAQEPV